MEQLASRIVSRLSMITEIRVFGVQSVAPSLSTGECVFRGSRQHSVPRVERQSDIVSIISAKSAGQCERAPDVTKEGKLQTEA